MQNIIAKEKIDYITLKKFIRELTEEYPFLLAENFAKTACGRDIPIIKLGRASEYVFVSAAFHGSEYITTNILLHFIEEVAKSIAQNIELGGFNMRKVMMGRGVIFMPLVNVDGVEINHYGPSAAQAFAALVERASKGDTTHWNANARGVDINHNFNADWDRLHKAEQEMGIFGPSPTRYGGHCPESESETAAVVKLCRTYKMRHAIALHSQGEVIYWDYKDKNPPRAKKMAEIMATTSGYTLDEAKGIAEGGGFKDWFISEFNRPAFTVEVGRGENPLPIESASEIYNKIREMLIISLAM